MGRGLEHPSLSSLSADHRWVPRDLVLAGPFAQIDQLDRAEGEGTTVTRLSGADATYRGSRHLGVETMVGSCGPHHLDRLLPLVCLDHFFDLALDRVKIERGRRLHRRIVDRCSRQRCHLLLHQDKAPEFAGIEIVHIPSAFVV